MIPATRQRIGELVEVLSVLDALLEADGAEALPAVQVARTLLRVDAAATELKCCHDVLEAAKARAPQ